MTEPMWAAGGYKSEAEVKAQADRLRKAWPEVFDYIEAEARVERDSIDRQWRAQYDAIEAEADAARAMVKRAHTILASVQPAAHRATKQSPNEIARHFNQVLEDAIKEWCESYHLARAAEEDGCEEGT